MRTSGRRQGDVWFLAWHIARGADVRRNGNVTSAVYPDGYRVDMVAASREYAESVYSEALHEAERFASGQERRVRG